MTTTHNFKLITEISDTVVSVGEGSMYAYNYVQEDERVVEALRRDLEKAKQIGVEIVLVHTGSSQYNEQKIEDVLSLIKMVGLKAAMTTCCTPGGCRAGEKFLLCEKWEIPFLREDLSSEEVEVVVEKYAARKEEDRRRGYLHVEYERKFFEALAELEGVVQSHLLYNVKRGAASFIARCMSNKQPELTE